ncbi:MAG: hypothetical protein KKD64_15235 [Alphaproteobacteria bacterium]|nr:hypothetical protein [Alphaproteobacteria bacterium]MBU0876520.1 hypothetical protein [Alphaproteobacteria bacterium]MBU1770991.1 hypothetical protein [Alphaproteobacteria bacterium]
MVTANQSMLRNIRLETLFRAALCVIVVGVASGCASPVRVSGFGDLPPATQVKAYRIAVVEAGTEDQLKTALEAALLYKGLAVDANSEMGIEAGFSVRPRRVELENGKATATAFRPFCKRQLYVLSLIISARHSGKILMERQASAMRCQWAMVDSMNALANAAINQAVSPKFRTDPPPAPLAPK